MTDDSQPRRERRVARRRAHILEAAAQVFARQGFHRTTTKDIAEAADIAEGTIYNYFENKDDLLISLIDMLADLEARRESYAQSLDVEVKQAFRDMLVKRFALLTERNTLLLAVLPEIFVSPHLRELYQQRVMLPGLRDLEDHFRARIERGQLQASDVSISIRLFAALGLGVEMLILMGDTELQSLIDDPQKLVDVLMYVAFDGMLSIPPQSPDSNDGPDRAD